MKATFLMKEEQQNAAKNWVWNMRKYLLPADATQEAGSGSDR